MRIAPALLALSLLTACHSERDPQVAKVTTGEKQALDEAGEMLGATPAATASPGAVPPP